jgi:hypothetical protein
MERKSWTITTESGPHEVLLLWTYWSGHRELLVDGRPQRSSGIPFRWRSDQTVTVDSHEVVVRTRPSKPLSPLFRISLELDGTEVPPNDGTSKWETQPTKAS